MGTKKSGLKIKKFKSKITFDEEIITKDESQERYPNTSSKIKESEQLEQTSQNESNEDLRTSEKVKNRSSKRKRNASKSKNDDNTPKSNSEDAFIDAKSKKKKVRKLKQQTFDDTKEEIQEELNPMEPTINTTESLRKKKKKRHTELIDAKKVKTELNLQQNGLNYLSKWKHSKDQWKFEKLTQVWIQNSLYDDTKLPEKIWTTVLQYFESAKGKVKDDILNKAVKLYEKENSNVENRNNIVLNRSKDIIQSLSE